jgi:hypothetical protein
VHATARWYRTWHDGDDVRERTYDDVAAMRRKPAAKHSHAP